MKKLLVVLAALAIVAAPVQAATPPTKEQQAEFLKTCLKVAPEAGELCRCKSEAVMKLIDTTFMDVVIASMKGKDVPDEYYDAYNTYIGRSTEVCGMGSSM